MTNIVDGDTIDVEVNGIEDRVRLILIDTPEVHSGVECLGQEAGAFVSSLLPLGQEVYLERDVSERDRYDRLLRYVYLPDGRMVNELIVAEGYGQLSTYPPDVAYVDRIRGGTDGGKGSRPRPLERVFRASPGCRASHRGAGSAAADPALRGRLRLPPVLPGCLHSAGATGP